MGWWKSIGNRIAHAGRRSRFDAELAAEVEFHLEDHLDDAYRENRLRTMVLATFAAAAVILACVGLYGTLSYLVNSRRREVGLRLALGALRGQIVRRFLVQGLTVSALACAVGLALSVLSSRWLASMLCGVSPSDPLTLILVTIIVLSGATTASLIPAAPGGPWGTRRTNACLARR
jgi:ABC-type antimicrobial peptide transport system permease subunit